MITMAVDQPPFDDVRVRQAMRLIANREEMVQRVLSGHGRVGNDMYGVFDACYPPTSRSASRTSRQAMALLAEAGQEGLTIDLFAPDDTAGLADLIAVFADQASAAGVTVNAQVLDGATYWGDEYTKRTFATSFWGTRPYLNQVAAGQPAGGDLPGDALAARRAATSRPSTTRRWPRPTRRRAARSSRRCSARSTRRAGTSSRSSTTSSTPRPPTSKASYAQPERAQPRPLRPRLQEHLAPD